MNTTGKRIVAAGLRNANEAQAVWELPHGPLAARQARSALRSWLAGFGIDPAEGPGFDIILAASELAANAGMHGLPPLMLDAWLDRDGDALVVSVCVSDASQQLQDTAEVPLLAEHGRGLAIVAALALRLDIRATPDGKEAWFEVAVPVTADRARNWPMASHHGPFGMNHEVGQEAADREALAS